MSTHTSFQSRLPRTLLFVVATVVFGLLGHTSGGGTLPVWWTWVMLAGVLVLPHDLLLRKSRHLATIGLYTALSQGVVHIWLTGVSNQQAASSGANAGADASYCPHPGHCFALPSAVDHSHHGWSMVVAHAVAAAAVTTATAYSSRVVGCLLQALLFLFVVPCLGCPSSRPFLLPAAPVKSWSSQDVARSCPARGPPRGSLSCRHLGVSPLCFS